MRSRRPQEPEVRKMSLLNHQLALTVSRDREAWVQARVREHRLLQADRPTANGIASAERNAAPTELDRPPVTARVPAR
ncbi:MAG: hypothetical protein ACJ761_06870 [Chloroflexota bacterium]